MQPMAEKLDRETARLTATRSYGHLVIKATLWPPYKPAIHFLISKKNPR